jgi:hypothetical protein
MLHYLLENPAGVAAMVENPSDPSKSSDQRADDDARPEKAEIGTKRQSGRPPARPPYEQNPSVNRNLK